MIVNITNRGDAGGSNFFKESVQLSSECQLQIADNSTKRDTDECKTATSSEMQMKAPTPPKSKKQVLKKVSTTKLSPAAPIPPT